MKMPRDSPNALSDSDAWFAIIGARIYANVTDTKPIVACLAGGDAYVVPTSQHVLQLAARRAASPPPRAPSTTATVSGDDRFDEQMKASNDRFAEQMVRFDEQMKASRRARLKDEREVMIIDNSVIALFIACLVYIISTTP